MINNICLFKRCICRHSSPGQDPVPAENGKQNHTGPQNHLSPGTGFFIPADDLPYHSQEKNSSQKNFLIHRRFQHLQNRERTPKDRSQKKNPCQNSPPFLFLSPRKPNLPGDSRDLRQQPLFLFSAHTIQEPPIASALPLSFRKKTLCTVPPGKTPSVPA